jgi:Beta-lactamase enzyme family
MADHPPFFPSPFPPSQNSVSLVSTETFRQAMSDLLRQPRFARMGVVAVDLTKAAKMPDGSLVGYSTFGALNPDKTMNAASVSKVAAMTAAFRLRDSFPLAANGIAAPVDDLIQAVTSEWKPIVEAAGGSQPKDFPKLREILSITGNAGTGKWTVRFQDTFWHHMEDMIVWSDNKSASYCIQALGYSFIAGTMKTEGLYEEGLGGLWLSTDYGKGKEGRREPKSGIHHAASAAALARLLVLIDRDALITPSSSKTMRYLMQNSWMNEEFKTSDGTRRSDRKPSRYTVDHFGKLGVYAGYQDAAVFSRTDGSKTVRYALAMLGGSHQNLVALGRRIDDLIFEMH